MISQVLLAALTFAFSGVGLWMAARMRRDASTSRDWPIVPGGILERGVEALQSNARSFLPAIRYAYTVDGKHYVGRQVYRTGRAGSMKSAAQRLADAFPDPVPVHYNPR